MPLGYEEMFGALGGDMSGGSSSYLEPLSMPQMQDPFSIPQTSFESQGLFPQINSGNIGSYEPAQPSSGRNILGDIVQAAFIGMASGAQADNWAQGLGMGFTGYTKYQQEQEQYRFMQEQQTKEEERRSELHEMQMSKLLTEQEKIRAELDFMPDQERMAIAEHERRNMETLSKISEAGITMYGNIEDTPEAKKAFLNSLGDLTGGKVDFYPTLDPSDDKLIPIYRIDKDGFVPAGTPIEVMGLDGKPYSLTLPGNADTKTVLETQNNALTQWLIKYNSELDYKASIASSDATIEASKNRAEGGLFGNAPTVNIMTDKLNRIDSDIGQVNNRYNDVILQGLSRGFNVDTNKMPESMKESPMYKSWAAEATKAQTELSQLSNLKSWWSRTAAEAIGFTVSGQPIIRDKKNPNNMLIVVDISPNKSGSFTLNTVPYVDPRK